MRANMFNDPLFFNKVAAAIIGASLIAMTAAFITSFVYQPKMLDKHAYAIDGGTVVATAPESATKPDIPESIMSMLAKASVSSGEKIAKKCTACHTFTKGGKNRIGPNLWETIGKKQAVSAGYGYSSAFKKLNGDWTYAELNKFLWKPKKYVKGTKMSFVGLKKAKDRAALIAYMRSLSDNPQPLP